MDSLGKQRLNSSSHLREASQTPKKASPSDFPESVDASSGTSRTLDRLLRLADCRRFLRPRHEARVRQADRATSSAVSRMTSQPTLRSSVNSAASTQTKKLQRPSLKLARDLL